MHRRALITKFYVCFLLSVAIPSVPLHAEEILGYLPNNALSFALVRDVQTTSDKIVKFVEIFNEELPAPLAMAQAMTGLSEGLDLNGDALFALLPMGETTAVPAPMFLLPVEDYAALAASIQADATGEICRVNIADEDVLIARHGVYALVMNLEHREIMQNLLGAADHVPKAIDEYKDWIAGNDLSVMVTSAGIKHLSAAAKKELKAVELPTEAGDFDEQAMANDMLNVGDVLPFSELIEKQIKVAGVGLALDETINARLRWTVELQKTENDANAESETIVEDKPLFGYADESYALAGGGPLPQELVAQLPELCMQISRDMAGVDGRGDYTEEDWAELRESYESAFAGLRGLSVLLVPVAEKEPLLSIFFTRLQVVDSAKYLDSLQNMVDLANRLSERSKGDIKLHYDISPISVADAKGFEISCDLDRATGDGDNHIWQTLLTAFLGIDHKLSVYCCAVDEIHVAVGIESKSTLSKFIEGYRQGDVSLSASEHVQKTLKLLEIEPRWLTLINPQGFVDIVQSAVKSLMILGFAPEIPAYPIAPPLGMALEHKENSWQGEMVMPVEAARAMAEFAKEVEKSLAQ
jgi:hypothetical protein